MLKLENIKIIFIFSICIITLITLSNPVFGQNCRTFGFDITDNSYLKYFSGDLKPTSEDYIVGNGSLMIRDATPGSSKEITTSVIPHGESPTIKFWWKKGPKNALFFNLSFYINGELAETYNNGTNWDEAFVYDLKKYNSNSYKLKWHLEYNPEIKYMDIPPSSNAFINGLELCDLLFENESLEKNTRLEPINLTKPKNIFHVNPSIDLSKIIAQILKEQKQGNFTITILELEPGTYNLTNTLDVKELQDLKIKGDNDLLTKINLPSNKFALNISNSSNITIQNLVFKKSYVCINLYACRNCSIIDNILKNFSTVGIVINNSKGNNILRNNISSLLNYSHGICLMNNSSGNNLILNNIHIDNTDYFLDGESRDNTIIIGKDVEKCIIKDKTEEYEVCTRPLTGFKILQSNLDCQNMIRTRFNNVLKIEGSL